MTVKELSSDALNDVWELFCSSFEDDPYYRTVTEAGKENPFEALRDDYSPSIEYCLKEAGSSFGVYEGDSLIAFILSADFQRLCSDPDTYSSVFGINKKDNNTALKLGLQDKLARFRGQKKAVYCLSLAVSKKYRRQGIASLLMDRLIETHKGYDIISDVSNEKSLNIHIARGFTVEPIADGYFFIHRSPDSPCSRVQGTTVRLAIPETSRLDPSEIPYRIVKKLVRIADVSERDGFFVKDPQNIASATVCEISLEGLFKYQRNAGLSDFEERINPDYLLYVRFRDGSADGFDSEFFTDFVEGRSREWNIVPDVFVSIPCICPDIARLPSSRGESVWHADLLLKNLDFRTKYESGVSIRGESKSVVSSSIKERIKRTYLGSVPLCLFDEDTLTSSGDSQQIGKQYNVDLYLSYDTISNCAVLGLYSLSCPFMISVFFDSIIRNQIVIKTGEKQENLYDYLFYRFGIVKSGTPKIFSIIPKDRKCLSEEQIGSLLCGEKIYSEGESFGKIIDRNIIGAIKSEHGMGLYDRGIVLADLNVIMQFMQDPVSTVEKRIEEAIITQFYIELILFEEAAIVSTDAEIEKLLGDSDVDDPVIYLESAEKINENYAKTISFWNIRLCFPTSQRSLDTIRKAFSIDELLEKMERNKSQLQSVFDAKNEAIDRKDSRRIDTSLAALALLAISSALIDTFDFIGAWKDYFTPEAIVRTQFIFSLVIGALSLYILISLFGIRFVRWIGRLLKKAKKNNTRK